MASTKTKRMAAVTTLSAALLLGGVAAAQADGPVCTHGKGKGEGTGAPGQDKGKGAERGWPHGCKDKDKDKDKPEKDQDGSDNETGAGQENTGGEVDGGDSNVPVSVEVDVILDADLPEPPDAGAIADDAVQNVVGIITPAAVNAVGQTLETADTATDLLKNDVSAIVDVLDSAMAGATSLELGSADAGINVGEDGASGTINVTGATSGVTSLGGQFLEGVFGIASGTTGAVTSLVAGMSLPI